MASKKIQQQNPVTTSLDPLEAAKVGVPETDAQRKAREAAAAEVAAKQEAKAKAKAAEAENVQQEKEELPPAPPKAAEVPQYRVANQQPVSTGFAGKLIKLTPGLEFTWDRYRGEVGIKSLRRGGVKLEPVNDAARAHDAKLEKEAEEKAAQRRKERAEAAAAAALAAKAAADKARREAAKAAKEAADAESAAKAAAAAAAAEAEAKVKKAEADLDDDFNEK